MKKIFATFITITSILMLHSCTSEKSDASNKTPQSIVSENYASSQGSIVGKWHFKSIDGSFSILGDGNNQIPEINKVMEGSYNIFNEDGTTQAQDNYYKKESKGTYEIINGQVNVQNDMMRGVMNYKVDGNTLTIIWPKDDYIKLLSELMN